MVTVKQKIAKIIKRLPDDSSYDEILRELAFERMIERGVMDSKKNATISNKELKHRIVTW